MSEYKSMPDGAGQRWGIRGNNIGINVFCRQPQFHVKQTKLA
jgi:hypothetical protein